jgi:hypothetical protein
MSWLVVFLLFGFWVLGLLNGYSFGGLIHILLLYAGLIVIARLIERRRRFRDRDHSGLVVGSHLDPGDP